MLIRRSEACPSLPKSIAWSGPIPLEEIKTIGQRLGGTVNDVLLATFTVRGTICKFDRTSRMTPVFMQSYPSTGARQAPRWNWAIESRPFFSLYP